MHQGGRAAATPKCRRRWRRVRAGDTLSVRVTIGSVFVLALLLASGCRTPAEHGHARPASSAAHDARVIGKLLALPAVPREVAYEEIPRGTPGGFGPTDFVLVAVLSFDQTVIARLAKRDGGGAGPLPRLSAASNRPWFPEAVKAALLPAGSGGVQVRGQELDGQVFLRPPYATIQAVAVDGTDYVIVVAATS